MGKGGGSGGGGSSGKVEWPEYFQTFHSKILDGTGVVNVNSSLADEMNTALATNPFTAIVPFDPQYAILDMHHFLDSFMVNKYNEIPSTVWHDNIVAGKAALTDHVYSESEIIAAEAAFNNIIDDEYEVSDLPRFQRGMQDVNAVVSSAFVTGKALLDRKIVHQKAQFAMDLRLQNYRDKTSTLMNAVGPINYHAFQSFLLQCMQLDIEAHRYEIVAQKEYVDQEARIEESEAKWHLEVFTIGGNVLASGHGGVSSPTPKATPIQSAIGGAMSGAAMGGMLGWGATQMGVTGTLAGMGPVGWGIGIGALLGGLMGGLS